MINVNQKENFNLNKIPKNIRNIGLLLYWCEGTRNHRKTKGGKKIELANSDEKLILLFLKFLRSLKIDEKRLRGKVKVHKNHDVKKIENHWSKITGIPVKQFHKPIIRNYSSDGKGSAETFTIIYSSTALWNAVMEGIRKLQELNADL
jgi:hypothetical protein